MLMPNDMLKDVPKKIKGQRKREREKRPLNLNLACR